MLVVVSDLHFVDGTAGEHNLPVEAYDRFLDGLDVLPPGGEVADTEKREEVCLLFLGDIFDVVRSQTWLRDSESDLRPWGTKGTILDPTNPDLMEEHRKVLTDILAHPKVAATCKVFRDRREQWKKAGINVRFHYVPGNHDRFLHADPKAREKAVEALSLDDDPEAGFDWIFKSKEYHVVGFHGHEVDRFNFGGPRFHKKPKEFDQAAYTEPSIGEVITVEVASRLPLLVAEALQADDVPGTEVKEIVEFLTNMDNIRPIGALFGWLRTVGTRRYPQLNNVLDRVVERIFNEVADWEYVDQWSRVIDQDYVPEDAKWYTRWLARVLDRDFDEYLKRIDSLKEAEDLLGAAVGAKKSGLDRYKEIKDHPFYTQVLKPAFQDIGADAVRYLVYGHTHVPEIVPIENTGRETVVFNTGTFRPRVLACQDDHNRGFVTHKTLSYAIFYREGEEPRTVDTGETEHQKYEFWEARLAQE